MVVVFDIAEDVDGPASVPFSTGPFTSILINVFVLSLLKTHNSLKEEFPNTDVQRRDFVNYVYSTNIIFRQNVRCVIILYFCRSSWTRYIHSIRIETSPPEPRNTLNWACCSALVVAVSWCSFASAIYMDDHINLSTARSALSAGSYCIVFLICSFVSIDWRMSLFIFLSTINEL